MNTRTWFLSFAALSLLSSASAGASPPLPDLRLDWELTTEIDCVSPENPGVRLRVVSHADDFANVAVLSVLTDGRIIASDSPLRQTFGPSGRSLAGRQLTLRLSDLPGGGLYGRLEGPRAGGLPARIFHCQALR